MLGFFEYTYENGGFVYMSLVVACVVLAQAAFTCILTSSVKARLKAGCTPEAVATSQKLLTDQLQGKRTAFRNTLLPLVATLAIGVITHWIHPDQNWSEFAPPLWIIGVEWIFHIVFSALDNIQDETAQLGQPQKTEMGLLAIFGVLSVVLLRANKVYTVRCARTVIGTNFAGTADTKLWRIASILLILFVCMNAAYLPTWEAGPPTRIVIMNVAALSVLSASYEKLTQAGNPLGAPHWLINLAHEGLHYYVYISIMMLLGLFPLGWLVSEVLVKQVAYFSSKIFQHQKCVDVLLEHRCRRKSLRKLEPM